MAVEAEEFYADEVENIIQAGNKLRGDNFKIEIQDCPNLSKLIVACTPVMPSRHIVETVAGHQGVEINEPGPLKTGGMFPVTFHDGFKGLAFDEYMNWMLESVDITKRKTFRVYGNHELGKSNIDVTYFYAFPEMEDADFDAENKTAPMKFTCNIHFANRRWTKNL
ncbi:hypothetical protein KKI24_27230 [bacterium]|nr:hypothetical protein [bacterium]